MTDTSLRIARGRSRGGIRHSHEQLRMKAAVWFTDEAKNASIAARLSVSVRTVEKWRRIWREGGVEALRSKGQGPVSRLTKGQLEGLNRQLLLGPAAHGLAGRRWTLAKVALLIEQTYQVHYTLSGVRKLLLRNGWSKRRSGHDTSPMTWVLTNRGESMMCEVGGPVGTDQRAGVAVRSFDSA
ncbi:helix-turn-helix domain-containing protein [Streptomyces sp. Tue6028]|uniref:helix-turn-helix domain-containing protein n=1 Tax=Streptomyces sp. Tue6028 TaxID=2036037 RepID=UPI003D72E5C3